jgi:hypothetical protein
MSRGGMRWGAGRPASKAKAEHLQRVDIREWARRGYLKCPAQFVWSWKRGDEPAGSVSVWVYPPESVTLRYSLTTSGQQQANSNRISLEYVACRFGGFRPWFACPCCARRVAVLYLRAGRFACRHCQGVAYASQSEDIVGRLWRRQAKLEARLGEYWRRPKGMRQWTYKRILGGVLDCEQRRDDVIERLMMKLF